MFDIIMNSAHIWLLHWVLWAANYWTLHIHTIETSGNFMFPNYPMHIKVFRTHTYLFHQFVCNNIQICIILKGCGQDPHSQKKTAHPTEHLHLSECWAVFIQLDYWFRWWYAVEWAVSSESAHATLLQVIK